MMVLSHFYLSFSYANQMLVIYNVRCNDDERIFFNITRQNIQPRNCGEEPAYVTNIKVLILQCTT